MLIIPDVCQLSILFSVSFQKIRKEKRRTASGKSFCYRDVRKLADLMMQGKRKKEEGKKSLSKTATTITVDS